MDRFDIFVKQRPTIAIEDGLVHVSYQSGNISFQVVMPMGVFMQALAAADEVVARWRLADMVKEPNDPVPIGTRKRK